MRKFFSIIGLTFILLFSWQKGKCQMPPQQKPSPSLVRNIEKSFSLTEKVRGEVGIWYKFKECHEVNGITHASLITKPFIICEGFDIMGDIDLIETYFQLNT